MENDVSKETTQTSSWSIFISPHISLVIYLLFIAVLIRFEREFIINIADPGTFPPNLYWQLLWPVGLLAIALLLPLSLRWFFLGTVGLLSILLIAGDAAYFDFFGTVTSAYMVTSVHQLIDVRDSVFALISSVRILPALIFLPFFIFGFYNIQHIRTAEISTQRSWFRSSYIFSLVLVLMNLLFGFIAWHTPIYEDTHHPDREKWVQPSDHWTSNYSRSSYAATFGIFNYHVMDLIHMIRDQGNTDPLSGDRKNAIQQVLLEKSHLNQQKSPFWGVARGRHVIIVQLESLQHFLLELSIQGHQVMPVLNDLKNSSLNWDYIFDVSHLGRTADAEFATMASMLPDHRKAASLYSLSNSLVTLPKELNRHGYTTASVHGFKRSFWNRAYTHPAFGIGEMHFEERFTDQPKLGLGVSDKGLFRYSANLLTSSQKQLHFLFVISLTSHYPYIYVPEEYLKPYAHLRREDGYGLIAPYLASASYTDEALGAFLQILEKQNLLKDSLLIIYGDHDRGQLGNPLPIPELGNRMNSITEDRIPLIISIPGKEELISQHAQNLVGVMGGLQDLAPTILHLLGEDIPLGMMGTHLFVDNEYRDAIPLPAPRFFAYRGALSLPNGTIFSTRFAKEPLNLPLAERALTDQLVVQDLLDHYDEIMEGD